MSKSSNNKITLCNTGLSEVSEILQIEYLFNLFKVITACMETRIQYLAQLVPITMLQGRMRLMIVLIVQSECTVRELETPYLMVRKYKVYTVIQTAFTDVRNVCCILSCIS